MSDPAPIVWLAGCDWWYHPRRSEAHYAALLAGRRRVIFVNSMTMGIGRTSARALGAKLARKLRSILRCHRQVRERLTVVTPLAIPLFGLAGVRRINGWLLRRQLGLIRRALGPALPGQGPATPGRGGVRRDALAGPVRPIVIVANPLFGDALEALRPRAVVYFVTDKLDADPETASALIARADRRMAERADRIVCVSQVLCRAYAGHGAKVEYLPHGVDFAHFAAAGGPGTVPDDLASLAPPVAGYVGSTESVSFDADLFVRTADLLPRWSFVLIGPVDDPAPYAGRRNVHLLGPRPYERLPEYLRGMAVCLLPLRQTEWVRYCNPVKLREYLAAGKPVVSTDMPELRRLGRLVHVAQGAPAFAEAIERAWAEDDPARRAARAAAVRDDTWDRRLETLEAILQSLDDARKEPLCAASAAW